MFQKLGNAVVRFWPILLICWIGTLALIVRQAPPFGEVIQHGEFAFLPKETSPSLQGEELVKQAWDDPLASRTVIVVRRESNEQGLLPQDREFIEGELRPAIEQIAEEEGGLAFEGNAEGEENQAEKTGGPPVDAQGRTPGNRSIIARVRTFNDKSIGRLLDSQDNKATLVVVEFTTEFLDSRNGATIDRIEGLFTKDEKLLGDLERQFPGSRKLNRGFRERIPVGLALATSGDATVGRDMMRAAGESADATEKWTVILVVVLLIAIYRAPGLAIIPLLTVGVGTEITLGLLAILAKANIITLFQGVQVYVKVLCYGAGVDYCLFLIARYKEELDDGADYSEAVASAISKVGATLTASAFTVICGIGMMRAANFGKFQQAGTSIAFGLTIVLCTAVTFTPSLLRLAGRWAFWPKVSGRRLTATAGWISPTSIVGRLVDSNLFQAGWKKMGQALQKRPGTIWLASVAVMAPFAVVGLLFHNFLSYGLLTELPQDKASVVGARAIQEHYPAGIAGPVTILLKAPNVDFRSNGGIKAIRQLVDRLQKNMGELDLADIRSAASPIGIASAGENEGVENLAGSQKLRKMIEERIRRDRSMKFYVSPKGDLAGHVTRLEFVFQDDPFSRDGIEQLNRLQEAVTRSLTERSPPANADLAESNPADESATADATEPNASNAASPADISAAELFVIGPTASIRDLKAVTDGDQIRIDIAVVVAVFLILVLLLRRPAICFYLIISVFFSYLVTLGMTFVVFWFLDGADFAGLDWKVPIFLFCILIAVGEDYNIFLMTRIDEEQKKHGTIDGVTVALQKTGSIISSCGIIMAGTFSSLLAGSLAGMHQLGFALAFGVLLDTFVVRPILVPAYLIMLYRGQLGIFAKFHGADELLQKKVPVHAEATHEH